MASKQTSYGATYNLTEFDLRNMEFIEAHTGLNKASVIHYALFFCQTALRFGAEGKCTGILYKRGDIVGTTVPISAQKVAEAYNQRTKSAQPVNVRLYRNTDALQAIHDIKKAVKASTDSVAVAYALEYAATTIKRMQECNARSARIFFSSHNNPSYSGQTYKKHPFDITLGNKFRRAKRNMKTTLGKLNPLRKKPQPLVTEAAAAPTAPPTDENAGRDAVEQAARKSVESEIGQINSGTTQPIAAMKPMRLRKRGFNL